MKTGAIANIVALAVSAARSGTEPVSVASSSASSSYPSSSYVAQVVSPRVSTRNELMFVSDAPTVLSWSVMTQSPYISFSLSEAVNDGCQVRLTEDVLGEYTEDQLTTIESSSIAVRMSFVREDPSKAPQHEASHTYIFFRPLACYKDTMSKATAKFDPSQKQIVVSFDATEQQLEACDGVADGAPVAPTGAAFVAAGAAAAHERDEAGVVARVKETITIDETDTVEPDSLQSFKLISDLVHGLRGTSPTTTSKPAA